MERHFVERAEKRYVKACLAALEGRLLVIRCVLEADPSLQDVKKEARRLEQMREQAEHALIQSRRFQ